MELGGGRASNVPVQIGIDNDWVSVSTKQFSNLALKSNGTLWSWGDNRNGELGLNDQVNRSIPVQVGTDTDWRSIGIGQKSAFAIKNNNTLSAWGDNSNGQYGDATTTDSWIPKQVGTSSWKSIHPSNFYTIGIQTNGTLWETGYNNNSFLNSGNVFTQIGSNTWNSIDASHSNVIGITLDNTLWLWGYAFLGNGSSRNSYSSPTQVSTDSWRSAAIGSGGSSQIMNLAVKSDGTLWGWGDNSFSVLGLEDWQVFSNLTRIGNENDWKSVGLGVMSGYAMKADGRLYESGSNDVGQLGLGSTPNTYSFVNISSGFCPFPPKIYSFTPVSGEIGSSVTITGSGFSITSGENLVTFQGIKGTVTASTSTSLTVTVPSGASMGPISVKVNNLIAKSSQIFDASNACNNSSFATANTITGGSAPYSATVNDVNGDGKPDIISSNANSNSVSISLNTGNGIFQNPTTYDVSSSTFSASVGDFNADGNQDLVTANWGSNDVSVLYGTGSGTFQNQSTYAVGTNPNYVCTGDFNADGYLDLVTSNNASNNISVLLGTSAGTFLPHSIYSTGTNPSNVCIGDFNGDGKQDLATTNSGSNNISILLGTGAGTFLTQTNYAVGINPNSISIGDFNGDGIQDVVNANRGSNNVSILLGSGTGTFSTQTNFAVGSYPRSISVGDFNGDGKHDVAAANWFTSNVSILIGTGSFLTQATYAVDTQPVSISVGDLNGDGKHDLITSNGTNLSVLVSNCTTIGADFSNPISAGILAQGSVFTNTQNNNPANGFKNDYGQASDDIFYSFTITEAANVTVSHCSSELSDTYLNLFNESQTLMASTDDDGPDCKPSYKASLARSLNPGTYYVASEGYSNNSGNITTTIKIQPYSVLYGESITNPIDIGNLGASFCFSDTKDNSTLYTNSGGQASPDIYYKFVLTSEQTITASTCGSVLNDTYLSLLNSDGSFNTYNDDGSYCANNVQAAISTPLAAGTYYLRVEGYNTNAGIISLSFKTTGCSQFREGDPVESEIGKTASEISIYPNPTNGNAYLKIPALSELISVKITDISGKVMDAIEGHNIVTEISTSHFPNGIYYVTFQLNGKTISKMLQVVK